MSETFGRYQLIKKLATGGMGQVYLARQKGPVGFEKLVVVKRILPHLSEEEDFIQMFFDEARIAAVLNHPNIAQIYDLGEVDGTYYIAMEYVHGESLRALNQRANSEAKGIPLALKCRIISDAAAGLDYAHRARGASGQALNLIHRDVSPQNILVGFNGGVKLIDFGVAKAAGKISTTMTGAIKGKYAYMSPEQARGEELDSRSDIFGLGVVFYETLTSTRLFKRDSETATLKAVVTARISAPSSITKGVPKQLDQIVLKALARNRKERFQTANELQLAIEELLVRQRMPATTAHLAAYMRELYGDTALDEKTLSEGAPKTPSVRAPPRSQEGSPPAQQRRSFDEIAAERASRPVKARAEGARSSSRSASGESSRASGRSMVPDLADLDRRLSHTRPTDTARGLFFNSVLGAVTRFAGPIAEPAVRGAAGEARQYTDAFAYPTADFLHVLWKAAEVIAPMSTGVDRAFAELGAACMENLLRSQVGRSLEQASSDGDPTWLLSPLLAALQPMLAPGERAVESSAPRSATLVFSHDVLPPPFYAGLLTHAFVKLRNLVAKVAWERRSQDEMTFRVQW